MTLTLRPEVAAFAQAMERKLRANEHKGGWQGCYVSWLIDRLREETRELKNVVARAEVADRLSDEQVRLAALALDEAADVANFAMMVADVCGGLPAEDEGAELERERQRGFLHHQTLVAIGTTDDADTRRHLTGALRWIGLSADECSCEECRAEAAAPSIRPEPVPADTTVGERCGTCQGSGVWCCGDAPACGGPCPDCPAPDARTGGR